MLEQLKQKLQSLRLGRFATLPVMGAAAVIITGLIVFTLWRSNQGYTALFGSQENIPIAQVVEILGGETIPYRIHPSGGQILVREGDLAKARMALASKGISALTPAGYELMDQEEMLGTSQFIQNVRYKRSLEGELAQSIMAMNQVESARVHLGITESSSFVLSSRNESSASVVVRLRYGQQLQNEQVAAIIQLVAGSVPGMKPAMVRVVDQQGQLLSENVQMDNNSSGYSNKNNTDLAKRLESETQRNIANLLNSIIGENNYRISVATQLDLSNIEETQERYNGYPRVSSENLNQENTAEEMAMGIPGTLSNRAPNANAAAETPPTPPGTPPQQATRNQAQRQYVYDRDIRHIRHPGYRVEKMSVAIVLNQEAPLLKEWTPEQLEQLNKLIADAAGINSERGDSLTLSQMAFSPQTAYEEPAISWWENPTIIQWVERIGIGLLALLLLIFGINPLLRRIARNDTQQQLALQGQQEQADSEEENHPVRGLPRTTFQGEENLPPQSSGLETKIEHLQLLAQSETERVAEVIKQWINSNERSGTKQDQ